MTVPLNDGTLNSLPSKVLVPLYPRRAASSQIAHIGVGGFHRAHEVVYLDDLANLSGKINWSICGIGLRSEDQAMRDALASQNCLYTVVSRSADSGEARVIGSLHEYLFAPDNPEAVIDQLAAPETRIVSLTITEGGYTLGAGDSVFSTLAEALKRRRDARRAPFTVLSCDNLQSNGDMARKTLLAFTESRDTGLHDWIAQQVAFPNCMVDRITPQTTAADRVMVRDEFSIDDKWPVVTEPFKQWVIEDKFSAGRPPLERVGVQFTSDVHPYEMMKIGLLNGSHSAMGYLGFLAGFTYIHEIMADPLFQNYIRRLMQEEVAPLLAPVPGIDLAEYQKTLVTRFANPTIKDQVTRICLDGSAKVPKFVLSMVSAALAEGRPTRLLSLAVAGWFRYLTALDEGGKSFIINDPLAARLTKTAREGGRDPRPLLDLTDLFGNIGQSTVFVQQVGEALDRLYTVGARATLARSVF